MFINYSTDTGFSINSFRKPNAVACADVRDVISEAKDGNDAVCDLSGAKEALEDGSLWSNTEREVIEDLHALICEHEDR